MVIDAPQPLVIPPAPSAVYDKIWLIGMGISAPDPNAAVLLRATLCYYRILPDGSKELSPTDPIQIDVEDLFALTNAVPAFNSLPDAVLGAIVQIGQSKGLL